MIIHCLLTRNIDSMYLFLLLLWMILYPLILDNTISNAIARISSSSSSNDISDFSYKNQLIVVSILPILMFLLLLLPILTVIILMFTTPNVLLSMSSKNISNWSLPAILLAQFIQFYRINRSKKNKKSSKKVVPIQNTLPLQDIVAIPQDIVAAPLDTLLPKVDEIKEETLPKAEEKKSVPKKTLQLYPLEMFTDNGKYANELKRILQERKGEELSSTFLVPLLHSFFLFICLSLFPYSRIFIYVL